MKDVRFSSTELKHIAVSAVALAFSFSLILYKDEIFANGWNFLPYYKPIFLINALIAVGLAFILHELGHKFVAQGKNCWAEFRAWPTGLFLAVAMALATKGGFIFAAPGAVMISATKRTNLGISISTLNKEDVGKIGIAGPLVNLLLACIFGVIAVITNLQIASISAQINIWLALFNLIPIGVLDGYKIWNWSKGIWATMLIICLGIFFLTAVI